MHTFVKDLFCGNHHLTVPSSLVFAMTPPPLCCQQSHYVHRHHCFSSHHSGKQYTAHTKYNDTAVFHLAIMHTFVNDLFCGTFF